MAQFKFAVAVASVAAFACAAAAGIFDAPAKAGFGTPGVLYNTDSEGPSFDIDTYGNERYRMAYDPTGKETEFVDLAGRRLTFQDAQGDLKDFRLNNRVFVFYGKDGDRRFARRVILLKDTRTAKQAWPADPKDFLAARDGESLEQWLRRLAE